MQKGIVLKGTSNSSQLKLGGDRDNHSKLKKLSFEESGHTGFQAQLTDEQLKNIEDVSGKVDKIEGKGLSSNDYTTEEKEKLSTLSGKEELNKSFSNSLKESASGNEITISDISPVEHELDILLSSDTVTDFSSVTVTKHGKNLLPLPDGVIMGTEKEPVCYIKDNKLKIKGTVSQIMILKITNGYSLSNETNAEWLDEVFLPAGTYTLSVQNKKGEGVAKYYPNVRAVTSSKKSHEVNWNDTQNRFRTFTIEEPISYLYITIYPSEHDHECNIQIEKGSSMTPFEAGVEPQTFIPNVDGKVEGVMSLYPTTVLETDNSEVAINCEYNRDINKAFSELTQAIISLGGNI